MDEAAKGAFIMAMTKGAVYRRANNLFAEMQTGFLENAESATLPADDPVSLFRELKRHTLQRLLDQCS